MAKRSLVNGNGLGSDFARRPEAVVSPPGRKERGRDVSESGIGDSVIRVIWQMWGDLASKIPSNNSNHQVQWGLIDSKIRVILNIWDDSD